jgi:hypothetical protein
MTQIYAVDRERWSKMSIFDQMGNIYSEVGRSLKAKSINNQKDYEQALARAIDLFDATVANQIQQHSPKAKEVLRAKEQFLDICSRKASVSDTQSLDRYFMQFAVAARLHR